MPSSGIAALLLDDGHTVHSMLKIPTKVNETSTCGINRGTADLIYKLFFFWDEAPMMSRCVYETVGRTFKDIMKTVDPKLEHVQFEGKLNIFSNDKWHGNSESIISQCINKSCF